MIFFNLIFKRGEVYYSASNRGNAPMPKESRNSIALQLSLDFERRIRHNVLDRNAPLPSLKEICRLHQISYMTAYRVYDDLARKGIIYSINGKGYFINKDYPWDTERTVLLPLEEIVTFVSSEEEKRRSTLLRGILAETEQASIPLRILKYSDPLKLSEHSGVIVRYSGTLMRLYQKLEYRRIRVVLSNNYFPELHCVIHDNFDAMKNIFDRMERCGCRSAVFCGGLFTDLGQANLNEREYAFTWECSRRSITPHLLVSGNMEELFSLLTDPRRAPDAVIFGANVTAEIFGASRRDNLKQGVRYFVFTTEENIFTGMNSWLFSGEKLGRAAVKMLLETSSEAWMLPNVQRIKGAWAE